MALSPEERLRALTEAVVRGFRRKRFKPLPPGWKLPTLEGGSRWVGGDLSREDLYGDDGR